MYLHFIFQSARWIQHVLNEANICKKNIKQFDSPSTPKCNVFFLCLENDKHAMKGDDVFTFLLTLNNR